MDEKQLVDGATALAEKQSRVIKIEPAEQPQNMLLRVAAYTRVSSDSEDLSKLRTGVSLWADGIMAGAACQGCLGLSGYRSAPYLAVL